jgi:hypothetical protein
MTTLKNPPYRLVEILADGSEIPITGLVHSLGGGHLSRERTCDLDESPGDFDGQRYDAVQTIRLTRPR